MQLVEKMKKATRRKQMKTYGVVLAAFVIIEILSLTGNLPNILAGQLVTLCAYAIAAISLNLVVGISGELSLGHAGFMCVGAYTSGLFTKCMQPVIPNSNVRFLLALLIGIVAAGVIGFLIGIPVLRLRGDYLAIVTLAFCQIIKNVFQAFYIGLDSTGLHFSMRDQFSIKMAADGKVIASGPQGITALSRDSSFIAGMILLLITLFIVQNLINSRDGRAIMAIRDNRIAAESVGISITKYKLMAFTTASAMAGAAGVLYAHGFATLNSSAYDFNKSILILVFVVLGGMGNILGSVVAAVILTVLPEMLRFLDAYRMLIYAIVMIVMMLVNWSPKALELREVYTSRFKKKTGKEA
ncbi:MAG: branched-chain amino acid ABC transporter permease [Lachnospiraceae bacterium]|nr:branched-chain amino acid ABC transporter permease [Lachnospiraceae bacterium]